MLKAHLDAVEANLLATSRIPANAGHMLHRGTPRESFISSFLVNHLSASLAVGSGEIIDAKSRPREPRNQFDIVIYKADFPKIDLGGGISAFFAESVVATIEVKSLLTDADLEVAVKSAATVKRLERHLSSSFSAGWLPPGIISFVVSYAGPVKIETVHSWLLRSENLHGLNQKKLPAPPAQGAGGGGESLIRIPVASEGLDAVICLGAGSVIFDNIPSSLITDDLRLANPEGKRQVISSENGNLLWLFFMLAQASSSIAARWPNYGSYLARESFEGKFLA